MSCFSFCSLYFRLVRFICCRRSCFSSYALSFCRYGFTCTRVVVWRDWVEYVPGSLPLVIGVPHGGQLKPDFIPDRTSGCIEPDWLSEDLARAILKAFRTMTGHSPHMVISHLHRLKMDANRSLETCADATSVHARNACLAYHRFIQHAKERAIEDRKKQHSSDSGSSPASFSSSSSHRGLFLDLHGQSHDAERIQLGYLLRNNHLQLSDEELNANDSYRRLSSICALASPSTSASNRFSQVLRGPDSLGALLQSRGFPAVPSPAHPHLIQDDQGQPMYFNGGYNTASHGSREMVLVNGAMVEKEQTAQTSPAASSFDSIQAEVNFNNVRDTTQSRANFASAFVHVIRAYFRLHYGYEIPLLSDAKLADEGKEEKGDTPFAYLSTVSTTSTPDSTAQTCGSSELPPFSPPPSSPKSASLSCCPSQCADKSCSCCKQTCTT